LERDVEAERHATTAEKKRLAELAHERDVLNKLRTQVGAGRFKACGNSTCICLYSTCVKDVAQSCRAPPSLQPTAVIAVLLQADSATQKQLDLVRMTENSKRTLEQEVGSYRWAPQSCGAGANQSKQLVGCASIDRNT
jgi:hypothetical protein